MNWKRSIKGQGGASLYAKRTVILNNLYGVDIDQGRWRSVNSVFGYRWSRTSRTRQTKSSRCRTSTSTFGRELADGVRVVHGRRRHRRPSKILCLSGEPWKTKSKPSIVTFWMRFGGHKNAVSSEAAQKKRTEAEQLIKRYSSDFDDSILSRFHEIGYEDMEMGDLQEFSPFHWGAGVCWGLR